MKSSTLKKLLLVGLLAACCTGFSLSPEELFSKGVRCCEEKNYAEAAKYFRQAAEQGYASAQLLLGVCYAEGEGVPKDLEQAVHWYRQAAEQGYAKAQNNLGVCYEHGKGVPKDMEKAVHWFRKSAAQGDVYAKAALRRLGQ